MGGRNRGTGGNRWMVGIGALIGGRNRGQWLN